MEPPVVILVGTSHPGNAGALARGAANFGVTELRFVAPRCDIHDEEALVRAVHARSLLEEAVVTETLEEALHGVSLSVGTTARTSTADNRFLRKPMDVREWAEGLEGWSGRMALVFGREDTGLLREEVNLLDQLVTVPTADYSSLNLAHAVTLLCYEHMRVRDQRSRSPERILEPDVLVAMHRAWDDLVDCTEPRPWRREVAKGVFRKVIGRSHPDSHEVHNIMGILGNALKRFDHPGWRTAGSTRSLRSRGLLVEPVTPEPLGEEE